MTEHQQSKLGIIAGGGQLPAILIESCRTKNRPFIVLAIKGAASRDSLREPPDFWMRLGDASQGFEHMRQAGVEKVIMAGKVRRPHLADLLPDWRTAKFLLRVGTRAFKEKHSMGDDRLLRAVIFEIESEGFEVIGLEEVLANLLVKPGAWGHLSPDQRYKKDIAVGALAAKGLGQRDVGQAVVVQNNSVIAYEGEDGTDALIANAGRVMSGNSKPVLVKMSKPGQDRRVDLPVIGPDTVATCIAAGFAGIAIEANSTLVIGKDTVVESADRAGLFLFGLHVEPS